MNYGMIIDHPDQFRVGSLVNINSIDGDKVQCTNPRKWNDPVFTLGLQQIRLLSAEVFNHLLRSYVEAHPIVDVNSLPNTPGLREFLEADWYWMAQYNTWEIRFSAPDGTQMVAWIELRPQYCDIGNFIVKVEGLPSLVNDSTLPRAYMDLTIAKREIKEWLMWRVFKHRYEYKKV